MIRVNRPAAPPAVLTTRGREATEEMCKAYDGAPSDYRSGVKLFDYYFDHDIYAHESVKALLLGAQHGKCAFCECKLTHQQYGDVEHFRPKAGYKQKASDPLGRPGYYWLAYEWNNLLISCTLCNQGFKKNLFPLRVARRRALCHRDLVPAEEPLLIDPSSEDPARHLAFHEELPRPARGSRKGKATIEFLGLDREELAEHRRDRLASL